MRNETMQTRQACDQNALKHCQKGRLFLKRLSNDNKTPNWPQHTQTYAHVQQYTYNITTQKRTIHRTHKQKAPIRIRNARSTVSAMAARSLTSRFGGRRWRHGADLPHWLTATLNAAQIFRKHGRTLYQIWPAKAVLFVDMFWYDVIELSYTNEQVTIRFIL